MATVSDAVRDFLATAPLAHVVTLRRDGTPHVQVTWAGLDGDDLVFATFFDERRVERLRRNDLVTASFEAKEYARPALYPYFVLRGHCGVSEGGALEVMDHLSQWYIGPGARYGFRDGPPGWVFRLVIDEIYGQGPWNPRWVEQDARG